MSRELSSTVKEHVAYLLREGRSTRLVANTVKLQRSTVHNIAKQRNIDLSNNKPGRPRKLTDEDARQLMTSYNRGLISSAAEGSWKLRVGLNITVHPQTVCRVWRSMGLKTYRRKDRPRLTREHRHQRLAYARMYADWTVQDWKRVVFADETKVNRYGSDGMQYCWRQPQGSTPHEVDETVKYGGGHIMVWGCMTAGGLGGYCLIEGNMNFHLYKEILEGELLTTIRAQGLKRNEVWLLHDGDPEHTSSLVETTLQ